MSFLVMLHIREHPNPSSAVKKHQRSQREEDEDARGERRFRFPMHMSWVKTGRNKIVPYEMTKPLPIGKTDGNENQVAKSQPQFDSDVTNSLGSPIESCGSNDSNIHGKDEVNSISDPATAPDEEKGLNLEDPEIISVPGDNSVTAILPASEESAPADPNLNANDCFREIPEMPREANLADEALEDNPLASIFDSKDLESQSQQQEAVADEPDHSHVGVSTVSFFDREDYEFELARLERKKRITATLKAAKEVLEKSRKIRLGKSGESSSSISVSSGSKVLGIPPIPILGKYSALDLEIPSDSDWSDDEDTVSISSRVSRESCFSASSIDTVYERKVPLAYSSYQSDNTASIQSTESQEASWEIFPDSLDEESGSGVDVIADSGNYTNENGIGADAPIETPGMIGVESEGEPKAKKKGLRGYVNRRCERIFSALRSLTTRQRRRVVSGPGSSKNKKEGEEGVAGTANGKKEKKKRKEEAACNQKQMK